MGYVLLLLWDADGVAASIFSLGFFASPAAWRNKYVMLQGYQAGEILVKSVGEWDGGSQGNGQGRWPATAL